jgi:putative hydrolase of the HAD superfamily
LSKDKTENFSVLIHHFKMKHKAIIFDLYGTLVDFPFAEFDAVVHQMATLLELPPDGVTRQWKQMWADLETGCFESVNAYLTHLCSILAQEVAPAKIIAAAQVHHAFQQRILVPKPGSLELLTELRRLGYKIALITNCALETTLFWPATPLSPLIDVALFSTIERVRKPDPAIFALASQRLQIEPHHCAMVGDSWQADVLGAHQARMAAYWLNATGAPSPDTTIAPSVASFAELLEHLKSLRS